MAIRTIRHKGLLRLAQADDPRKVPAAYVEKLQVMLTAINTAETVAEIEAFPGWRLHKLTGDLKGFWSLTVSGNLRLIFRFEDGDAYDLDLIDYH
jgi:toxin HigB-1